MLNIKLKLKNIKQQFLLIIIILLIFISIILIIWALYLFIQLYRNFCIEQNLEQFANERFSIPKKIWVFWDKPESQVPNMVSKCYKIIRKLCPDYEFNQINLENYKNFFNADNIDDAKILKIFENDKILITQKTDVLRHYLMKKFGGFWLDSSIILLESLDWIYKLDSENLSNSKYDTYMFKANYHSTNDKKPVLESWFIASKPNERFHTLVLDRLVNILNQPDLQMELDKLKADKDVDYQKFGNHGIYHIVYYIYIYTLYKDNISRIKFLDCNEYEYACSDCNGRGQIIIDLYKKPISNKEYQSIINSKLVKVTNYTRKQIQELVPINNSFMNLFYKKLNIIL